MADEVRVKVWRGGLSYTDGEYLGKGILDGTATVHFVVLPTGALISMSDPQDDFDEELLWRFQKIGGELIKVENNPRIVLDSGQVVYGCQVWWTALSDT